MEIPSACYRSANPSFNYTSVPGDGEEGGAELRLSGLRPYTRYTLIVQAYNQVGSGPLSEMLTTQTLEDVPNMPPEDVRCAALTSESLQVSWQPPPSSHSNGIIQGYKLNYEPMLGDSWPSVDEMEVRKTSALTTVLTGLRKYTNYSIQVVAFTRVGDGVPTRLSYCHTEEDVPGGPADIKVVVSSPQALFISWLPPSEPNGVITKYNLYTRVVDGREELNHGKRTLPSSDTYFEATGLQQHVEYQFWVTASTRVGEGQNSKVAAQVPTNRVPARITSFGGQIVRPWRGSATLGCSAVGEPSSREWYKANLEQVRTDSSRNIQLLPDGDLIFASLQPQDSANYTCQVENSQGSDRLYYQLIVQVPPSAPVLYVSSSTSSSILLHWKPGHNGGAPLTKYTLHYRTTHGTLEEMQLSRRATSHELKDLLCGNTYQLYLSAHNRIGSSPASPVLSVRTQGQPPGIPPAAAFLAPNSSTLVLRLNSWPDNGCPIQYFVIQYRPINEFHWTLVSNSVKMQRRFVVTNLAPSSVYQLKVEAYNVAGNNQAEFTFVTLTREGEPPAELSDHGMGGAVAFYAELKVLLPLMVALGALLLAAAAIGARWRNRYSSDRMPRPMKESQENQQNAETQRERYYATIHKVALQAGQDKIPETAEDISPYATFQLSEAAGAGLGGLAGFGATDHGTGGLHPNNTLLHSFMYHEHAMTEGCASPPPATTLRLQTLKSVTSRRRQAAAQRKHQGNVESDESESDADQLTSSRTESSNQLDAGKLKHIRAVSDFMYHGTSSTSSDISPMSEQKSLPRRGRSRWHVPSRSSLRTILPPMSVAETAFNSQQSSHRELHPQQELNSLKKLKLGLRSSLWSRPGSNANNGQQPNPSSDYSIAV
ncbi:hypothetical protein QAD02_005245 [Eretmocerus hayati]|uniref:Uncharacterized protein n=1 Tax=Eretmocerus hayati TaxID=131215 RepID=A0ACC2NT12_9HYME|nr:hypothetical protein QAD02_005245 [Eretmocerus hayati]